MATKLIFPSLEREPDQPLDLHTEVFVSHRGVFLDIGQFSVYVARFIKPKQRPLYPLMDGETMTFCRMPTTPRPSPRIWLLSASLSGLNLHLAKPTRSLKPQVTTGRSVFHMLRHRSVCLNTSGHIMSSLNPTLESQLAVDRMDEIRVGKANTKAGERAKEKGKRGERAGMAKAHWEVRPMATLWGSLDGTRATATPGIGTNNVAGTGAGTERLYDPLWRLGHILLFACREACLTSLKYVGHCTHFEHAKAVAQRKQHQSIQLHCFDFRNSLNEFKFYFHKLLEPCAGCSRQWFYRFALIIMAVQFFLAMAFSGVNIGVVMLHHFIWRCLAGATAVLCATCIRQPGQKVSIRICLIALVLPWHPTAFIQSIRSVPWVAL